MLANAFSNWRACDFKRVKDDTHLNNRHIEDMIEIHAARKDRIKEHNSLRAEKLITDFLKRNVI